MCQYSLQNCQSSILTNQIMILEYITQNGDIQRMSTCSLPFSLAPDSSPLANVYFRPLLHLEACSQAAQAHAEV